MNQNLLDLSNHPRIKVNGCCFFNNYLYFKYVDLSISIGLNRTFLHIYLTLIGLLGSAIGQISDNFRTSDPRSLLSRTENDANNDHEPNRGKYRQDITYESGQLQLRNLG